DQRREHPARRGLRRGREPCPLRRGRGRAAPGRPGRARARRRALRVSRPHRLSGAAMDEHLGQRAPDAPAVELIVVRADNPGPMTLTGTNSHVLRDEDQVWGVDPGPKDPEHLAELLLTCGDDARPEGVLVTHRHADHAAGAATLARQLTARSGRAGAADPAPQDPGHPAERLLTCGDDARPEGVLFTHRHADHAAGAATLARQLPARSGREVPLWAADQSAVPGSRPLPATLIGD